jgi:hypothetical protein
MVTNERGRAALGFGAMVAIFAAPRLAGCLNDLWLDEIWSLNNALELNSPIEILSRLHLDNNHPLNTLWLYALGDQRPAWAYRSAAWIAGLLATVLAGLAAAREQHRSQRPEAAASAAAFAVILFGGSYLLLHYASEARGYSAAVAFSLLAYYGILRGADEPRSHWAPVYWLGSALALLAHATAVHVIVGAVLWTTVRWQRERRNWRDLFGRLAWWHLTPMAIVALHWWTFLRHLAIGGGPLHTLGEQLAAACAYALGLPVSLAYPALLVALVLAATSLIHLQRNGSDRWIFYAVAILGSPAALLAVTRHELIFERYFLINLAFLLLLASSLLAAGWHSGGWRRFSACLLVAVFLLGNAIHTGRLLRLGRGEYRAALAYIAENSPEREITLGGDHDFRNGTAIAYHSRRLNSDKRFRYLAAGQWPREGPQWLVLHRQTQSTLPSTTLVDPNGNLYRLERSYSYAAMSGWNWFVLRNDGNSEIQRSSAAAQKGNYGFR